MLCNEQEKRNTETNKTKRWNSALFLIKIISWWLHTFWTTAPRVRGPRCQSFQGSSAPSAEQNTFNLFRVNIETDSKNFTSFLRLSTTKISSRYFSVTCRIGYIWFLVNFTFFQQFVTAMWNKSIPVPFLHLFEVLQSSMFSEKNLRYQYYKQPSRTPDKEPTKQTSRQPSRQKSKTSKELAIQPMGQRVKQLTRQPASWLYKTSQVHSTLIQWCGDAQILFSVDTFLWKS